MRRAEDAGHAQCNSKHPLARWPCCASASCACTAAHLCLAPARCRRHLAGELGDAEIDDLKLMGGGWRVEQGGGPGSGREGVDRRPAPRHAPAPRLHGPGVALGAAERPVPCPAAPLTHLHLRAQRRTAAVAVDGEPRDPQLGALALRLLRRQVLPQPAAVGWGGVGGQGCEGTPSKARGRRGRPPKPCPQAPPPKPLLLPAAASPARPPARLNQAHVG